LSDPPSACGSENGPEPHRGKYHKRQETSDAYDRGHAAGSQRIDRRIPEGVGDGAPDSVEQGSPRALTREVEEEQERVQSNGGPDSRDGYQQCENRCSTNAHESRGPGRRDPPLDRVQGRYMPRLEDLDLGHDAVGKQRRRGQVGQPLEGTHHLPGLGQLGATHGARIDVRLQRRDAESGLTVEQLIDFVW